MAQYNQSSQSNAKACVIWMHGLGADASDMAGLAQELKLTRPVEHVFLDAPVRPVTMNNHYPMRAWYDIYALQEGSREDAAGVEASSQVIFEQITTKVKAGFDSKQIFLAGFSQGGAMALYTALSKCLSLGGVVALSAYFPARDAIRVNLNSQTPFFFAMGKYDPIVLPSWSELSVDWLSQKGFNAITTQVYPMEHSVCREEIEDLSMWFNNLVT